MTDITQEIQAERAQIQAQERELNIKKIQLAIKELYAIFEDGQVIPFDDPPLEVLASGLKNLLHICQNTRKNLSTDLGFSGKLTQAVGGTRTNLNLSEDDDD